MVGLLADPNGEVRKLVDMQTEINQLTATAVGGMGWFFALCQAVARSGHD